LIAGLMVSPPDSHDIAERLLARMPADPAALTAVILAGHRRDRSAAKKALNSPDPHLRAAAIGALIRCEAATADLIAPLLHDSDSRVRRRAAQAAALIPGLDLSPVITDSDPIVAEMAIWACGEQETVTDDVLHLIISAATESTEPLVREAAAAALGAIGDRRGLSAILAACADKPAVRRRAVLALAPFIDTEDHEVVLAALNRALSDRDWQVRQAAEDIAPEFEPGIQPDTGSGAGS
jgi:HEAT repeat protein